MRTAAVIARDILVLASWAITMVVAAATFTTVLEAPYASLGSSPLVNALTTMSLSILAATAVAAAVWISLAKAVERRTRLSLPLTPIQGPLARREPRSGAAWACACST